MSKKNTNDKDGNEPELTPLSRKQREHERHAGDQKPPSTPTPPKEKE